ncbi:MAG: hypothetical protein P4L93_10185, partial [Coriobacteriia bacterium]|nr:hypothetical protein [Coriobacteriia bacterium]
MDRTRSLAKTGSLMALWVTLMCALIGAGIAPVSAFALSSGPNNAGAGASGGSGTAWSNPGNITTVGSPYATCAIPSSSNSAQLRATSYGFSIPTTAVVDGVSVTINRQSSNSSNLQDAVVQLTKDGSTLVGSNLFSGTTWPTSLTTASYGGTSNLWGTTWTPAEINASTFGVVLQAQNTSSFSTRTGTVDYIQVTVTYHMDTTPPATASVTSPASGSIYAGAGVPASFSGSAADDASGVGLNANSTTFTLQRPDGQYWNGVSWGASAFPLGTAHSATTAGTTASWTSTSTLPPEWNLLPDGVYTVTATAKDKSGNSFTGSAVTFTLDNTAPATATVTTPADLSSWRAGTMPATFSGSAADNAGGAGLNANSTSFTLQRPSDNYYWTGSAWQASAAYLAATNTATTSGSSATWTSSATMPAWSTLSNGVYTVTARATDKVGNTFTGTAVTFTLDRTAPTTASVTTPAN